MADFGTGSLGISYCDGHLASVCFESCAAWASMLLIVKFCTIMLLAPRGKRGLESYPWADWGFRPWIMLLDGGLGACTDCSCPPMAKEYSAPFCEVQLSAVEWLVP